MFFFWRTATHFCFCCRSDQRVYGFPRVMCGFGFLFREPVFTPLHVTPARRSRSRVFCVDLASCSRADLTLCPYGFDFVSCADLTSCARVFPPSACAKMTPSSPIDGLEKATLHGNKWPKPRTCAKTISRGQEEARSRSRGLLPTKVECRFVRYLR
jgi:hypothetical protein